MKQFKVIMKRYKVTTTDKTVDIICKARYRALDLLTMLVCDGHTVTIEEQTNQITATQEEIQLMRAENAEFYILDEGYQDRPTEAIPCGRYNN